ncbi:MAG: hypothetical protein IE923_00215 [Micrococcales bacterium]|nr:hypothetical protein [Micrococcales bacterium]
MPFTLAAELAMQALDHRYRSPTVLIRTGDKKVRMVQRHQTRQKALRATPSVEPLGTCSPERVDVPVEGADVDVEALAGGSRSHRSDRV